MKIGIGIDTGGTYTDAVVYDYEKRQLLASAKALTTKEDLSLGIGKALDALPAELLQKAELAALSTTLATNACVENKGGRAKLILWGVDRKVVEKTGDAFGLPPAEEIYFQPSFVGPDGESHGEIDWALFEENLEPWFSDCDAVGIVELYAMKDNAAVEKRSRALLAERLHIPAVCGHELFSDLNSVRRGASTLLNARLIPVIEAFLRAIERAFEARGIGAKVVIVRSDGSLMSEQFTCSKPVETLLCGPAASVMGGLALTGEQNCLIVDMGGTTTDVALVKDSVPVKVRDGVHVGNWKTFVKGLYIDTFALGGDSAVRCQGGSLHLEEGRVIPLCILADRCPDVLGKLAALDARAEKSSQPIHEFLTLVKDISGSPHYTAEEKTLCAALADGPLLLEEAAAAVKRDIFTLRSDRLEAEGIILRSGLTPTDVMHLRGDFAAYNREASRLAANQVARSLGCTVEALCGMVYDAVCEKLYRNLLRILLEDRFDHFRRNGLDAGTELLISESYRLAREGKRDSFFSFLPHLPATLVGIGAPIHIFLPEVARLLGTRAVIPEHSGVANAVGAVLGNITATRTVQIAPQFDVGGISGYLVYGRAENRLFEELEDAKRCAEEEASAAAREEAEERGAVGDISVTVKSTDRSGRAKDDTLYLGTEVTATAVGRIRL